MLVYVTCKTRNYAVKMDLFFKCFGCNSNFLNVVDNVQQQKRYKNKERV